MHKADITGQDTFLGTVGQAQQQGAGFVDPFSNPVNDSLAAGHDNYLAKRDQTSGPFRLWAASGAQGLVTCLDFSQES